jgi:hypothetical protein
METIAKHVRLFMNARRSGDQRKALYHLKLARHMQRVAPQNVARVAQRLAANGIPPQMVRFALIGGNTTATAARPSIATTAARPSVAAAAAPGTGNLNQMRFVRARDVLGRQNGRPVENVRRNAAAWLAPMVDARNVNAARPMTSVRDADEVVDILGRVQTLPEGHRTDVARVLRTYKNAGFHVAKTNARGDGLMRSRMALAKSMMNDGRFDEAIRTMAPLSGGNATNADPDIRTLENATRAIAYLREDGVASDPKTAAYVRGLMKFAVSR